MEIHIRPLSLSDLDQVMDIEPVAFGSHHWSRQSFVNELNNPGGHYFAAYAEMPRRLIGYSGFWLIGEEAHITTLAVHPDFRRQYIGERLLIHDISQAEKCGASWMTLEVRVSNESAQLLYYKYGFKSLGIRRNYYQDNNEDAMVLWTENMNSNEFKNLVSQRTTELNARVLAQSQTEISNPPSEQPQHGGLN
jgi:[ribosomal protein S18]-alanine N-acetyltransferase